MQLTSENMLETAWCLAQSRYSITLDFWLGSHGFRLCSGFCLLSHKSYGPCCWLLSQWANSYRPFCFGKKWILFEWCLRMGSLWAASEIRHMPVFIWKMSQGKWVREGRKAAEGHVTKVTTVAWISPRASKCAQCL